MKRIDADTFVITTSASGRTYVVHRRNRSKLRARWDVCNGAGGRYGTFATLPGAQLGADALTGRRPRAAPLDAASARPRRLRKVLGWAFVVSSARPTPHLV